MGSISDFLEKELLDHVFNAAYTSPTNVFVALSTGDPLDTGAGMEEPTGTGAYTRATLTCSTAASRTIAQKSKITFPQATANWGTITHYAIYDQLSGGNMLAHGSLNSSKRVVTGNTPSIATNEIQISYSAGEISDYLSNQLLDHAFRNQNYTAPDTYIALCTGDVLDTDTGSTISEPSAGAYARKQVNPTGGAAPTWATAAGAAASVDNADTITFTAPTGAWTTITALAIVDAATTGNLLFYENTLTDQSPDNGDTVEIPAGDLIVRMS
jgi:hypothetical protein